jgi:EAL and modified HD-GYP domain-containing signal transduction protein
MEGRPVESHPAEPRQPECNFELKYVARQPIFDAQKRIYGYELLYRSGSENRYTGTDPGKATTSVIADTTFLHGLENLSGGHKLFVNFPRELLTSGAESFIPSEQLVVEIVEDIEPSPTVLDACRRMKQAGYILALDDVTDLARAAHFGDYIDIIKVDLPLITPELQAEMFHRHASRGVTLLAEKVETHEEFSRLAQLGYGLFQGYFFSKPEMISRRDIPAYKWNYLRLLQAIYRPQLDPRELERIIKAEVALCYKLLRYLNSPVFGFRGEIRSVRHAITLLGEQKLKRWVTLLALASMGKDKPEELLVSCLLRASWCESMAEKIGMKEREGDLFLLGLFSRVDAILDRPMTEILDQLPVATDIKEALSGTDSKFNDVLRLVDTYEHADFDRTEQLAGALGIDRDSIPDGYLHAMDWAHEIHKLA